MKYRRVTEPSASRETSVSPELKVLKEVPGSAGSHGQGQRAALAALFHRL